MQKALSVSVHIYFTYLILTAPYIFTLQILVLIWKSRPEVLSFIRMYSEFVVDKIHQYRSGASSRYIDQNDWFER